MAYKRYRVSRRADIKHFRRTATRTKAINRSIGNAQTGVRF